MVPDCKQELICPDVWYRCFLVSFPGAFDLAVVMIEAAYGVYRIEKQFASN